MSVEAGEGGGAGGGGGGGRKRCLEMAGKREGWSAVEREAFLWVSYININSGHNY